MKCDHGLASRGGVGQRPDGGDDGARSHRQQRAGQSVQLCTAAGATDARVARGQHHGRRHATETAPARRRSKARRRARSSTTAGCRGETGHGQRNGPSRGRAIAAPTLATVAAGPDQQLRTQMTGGDATRLGVGLGQPRAGDDQDRPGRRRWRRRRLDPPSDRRDEREGTLVQRWHRRPWQRVQLGGHDQHDVRRIESQRCEEAASRAPRLPPLNVRCRVAATAGAVPAADMPRSAAQARCCRGHHWGEVAQECRIELAVYRRSPRGASAPDEAMDTT